MKTITTLFKKLIVLILLSVSTIIYTGINLISSLYRKIAPLAAFIMAAYAGYACLNHGFNEKIIVALIGIVLVVALMYILPAIVNSIKRLNDNMKYFIFSKERKSIKYSRTARSYYRGREYMLHPDYCEPLPIYTILD